MKIKVNGEPREFSEGGSVAELLRALGLSCEAVVVQRNDDIVDRDRYAETVLVEGDSLELVRFVGGG